MGRLEGKKAIVTGGAMGIGFGIAKRFLAEGADVLVADLDGQALEEAVRKLAGTGGGRVAALQADVAVEETGGRLAGECTTKFGGLDILVNNAGIYPQVPMLRMEPALFDKVYRINLKGLAFISKAAAAWMIEHERSGRIINIASIDALHPSMIGLAAYDASKGGVLMFTKSLALELGKYHINVNAIAPGGVATEGSSRPLEGSGLTPEQMQKMQEAFVARIPMGRMGVPEDIAGAALFLASEDADYITGETIVVDGGMLLA